MTTTKQRSPNYPSIGLGEAVSLIKKLYQAQKHGVFPPESAAGAWGYKSFSGPVRSKFSALRYYGLIEQKKGQEARLSHNALTIALRYDAAPEYISALKDAALAPPLFRELYELKRFLSSDDTLKHELIVNRRFTDDGADQFIEAFRATLAVAGLTQRGTMSGQKAEPKPPEAGEELEVPPPPNQPNPSETTERVVSLPLSASKWVNLRGPFPVTEKEWTQMRAVLDAMKPGLVVEDLEQSMQAKTGTVNESVQESDDDLVD